jgi:hypothetical protein
VEVELLDDSGERQMHLLPSERAALGVQRLEKAGRRRYFTLTIQPPIQGNASVLFSIMSLMGTHSCQSRTVA